MFAESVRKGARGGGSTPHIRTPVSAKRIHKRGRKGTPLLHKPKIGIKKRPQTVFFCLFQSSNGVGGYPPQSVAGSKIYFVNGNGGGGLPLYGQIS